jgi:hypothetical protein
MHFVLADVVWPALFFAGRTLAWWAIGLGLLVKLFFVAVNRWLTRELSLIL